MPATSLYFSNILGKTQLNQFRARLPDFTTLNICLANFEYENKWLYYLFVLLTLFISSKGRFMMTVKEYFKLVYEAKTFFYESKEIEKDKYKKKSSSGTTTIPFKGLR